MDDFKVGEKVTFEILQDGLPRWSHDEDRTGPAYQVKSFAPPKHVIGEVLSLDIHITFLVRYGPSETWYWPQPSFGRQAYGKIGYLRRVDDAANVTTLSTATNNDGRDTCFACGAKTKTVMGFSNSYQVCTKCGK